MGIQTTNDLSSIEIVQAIAEQTGQDPVKLPPLYDYINLDALDSLFTGSQSGQIEFAYIGCHITVSFDEEQAITVEETEPVSQ